MFLDFWVVLETEVSQWEVPEFILKLTYRMKTFKTWGKSLQLPYANLLKQNTFQANCGRKFRDSVPNQLTAFS